MTLGRSDLSCFGADGGASNGAGALEGVASVFRTLLPRGRRPRFDVAIQ